MTETKPNILMIIADQLTGEALSFSDRGPHAYAPAIESLAESGATFTNCHSNSPLCAPARASLMSSQLPRNHKVYDNGAEFSANIPTFLHQLKSQGYRTIGTGKMHFIGPDQLHGFDKRLTTNMYPSDFVWTPDWKKEVKPNLGTGAKRLKLSGVCKANNNLAYDKENHFRTLEFLEKEALKSKDKPFFLMTSYNHPHDPFMITEEYYSKHQSSNVGSPRTPKMSFNEHHPYNKWIQTFHDLEENAPNESLIKKSRTAYFGMVSYIDDILNEIIEQLKKYDLYEDTIIIFTSDHGEMLGEHGMWFKRTFYEGSVNVPLVISGPNIPPGKSVDKAVSLVDLGPTVVDLAGDSNEYTEKWRTDGDSFYEPLINKDFSEWKDEAIVDYLGEGILKPMFARRNGRYKYVHVLDHEPLLFDLVEDPDELENLIGDEDVSDLVDEYYEKLFDKEDISTFEPKIYQDRIDRKIINEAFNGDIQWDYQPFFDASKMYVRVSGTDFTDTGNPQEHI